MPTILITGANRGIGLNLARLYAAEGWRVIATARNPEKAHDLAALPGTVAVEPLEVTDHAAVEALAAKYRGQPVDILWNNAGVIGSGAAALGSIDAEELRRTLLINTYAPILIADAFLPHVLASDRKVMAFTSSRLGSIAEAGGGRYGYGPSKAGLNMACKALAGDLRGRGVIVLPLHPGHVATDMGGAGAPVSPDQSARGLKAIADRATLADSGKFVDYRGQPIPG
ncbi:MAG: SDR family oxidoreductase [Alphaproteobacteria bacterium]|nr:SDR family oxidoreductase [Alphaproteobacteria bacterium]MCB9931353.1 SDR family oxidoreductase [Alphaproteobacteria bacterium]